MRLGLNENNHDEEESDNKERNDVGADRGSGSAASGDTNVHTITL